MTVTELMKPPEMRIELTTMVFLLALGASVLGLVLTAIGLVLRRYLKRAQTGHGEVAR